MPAAFMHCENVHRDSVSNEILCDSIRALTFVERQISKLLSDSSMDASDLVGLARLGSVLDCNVKGLLLYTYEDRKSERLRFHLQCRSTCHYSPPGGIFPRLSTTRYVRVISKSNSVALTWLYIKTELAKDPLRKYSATVSMTSCASSFAGSDQS